MMVLFRKRIVPDPIKVCNDMAKANSIAMIQDLLISSQEEKSEAEQIKFEAIETELDARSTTLEPGGNWGALILDAKCIPDDIPYPVDLRLLNIRLPEKANPLCCNWFQMFRASKPTRKLAVIDAAIADSHKCTASSITASFL